jgi:GAF domain-containing protein
MMNGCRLHRTGLVGVVASTGQTIRISSGAHRDPRFSPDVDQRKDKTTHSILCCPIKAETAEDKSTVIGVISVRDEKDRGGFELEEEKLLKVFCAQVTIILPTSYPI